MEDDELARRLRVLADEAASWDGCASSLSRLTFLRRLRRLLNAAEGDAMFEARQDSHEWAVIGHALGMSGQGAGQRYRVRHGQPDPRPIEDQRRRPRAGR